MGITSETLDNYIKDREKQEEEQRRLAEESADAVRTNMYAEADRRLAEAKSAAESSFERNRVTYGETAERLGQMGLTGSGYSDNMMRDAYAARAQGISAAHDTHATERQKADITYNEAIRKAQSDYNTGMSKLTDEKYSKEIAIIQRYEEAGYGTYTIADIEETFSSSPTVATKLKDKIHTDVIADFTKMVNNGIPGDILNFIRNVEDLYIRGMIEERTYNEIKAYADTNATVLSAKSQGGEMEESVYLGGLSDEQKTQKAGAWAMDGLGYGYEGDELKISVGSSTFNADNAISAKLGTKVTDEAMNKALNKLATGNESEKPTRVSGWSTFWGEDTNSDKHANQLVVYGGKAYVFTQYGWFPIESDKVAAALLADVVRQRITPTPTTGTTATSEAPAE